MFTNHYHCTKYYTSIGQKVETNNFIKDRSLSDLKTGQLTTHTKLYFFFQDFIYLREGAHSHKQWEGQREKEK